MAQVDSTELIHFLEKEKQARGIKAMASQIIASQAGKKLRKKKRLEQDDKGANPGFDPETLEDISDNEPGEIALGVEMEMPQ